MFIQTESTPNPANLKFLPDRKVLASGTVDFASREAALHSPLANRLFEVEGVTAVFLGPDYITVTKMAGADWQVLKPAVLGAIMAHDVSGEPVVVDTPAPETRISDDQNGRLAMQIQELIDTRIRPAAAESGGDVFFPVLCGRNRLPRNVGRSPSRPCSTRPTMPGGEPVLSAWYPPRLCGRQSPVWLAPVDERRRRGRRGRERSRSRDVRGAAARERAGQALGPT